jgi:hypothetical protein
LYGIDGQGWFLGLHSRATSRWRSSRHVVAISPAQRQQGKDTRYINIYKGDEFDEAQMANWVKQAAALPGWVP